MEILLQEDVICGLIDKGKFCKKCEQKNNLRHCLKKRQFEKHHEPIKAIYKVYFYIFIFNSKI